MKHRPQTPAAATPRPSFRDAWRNLRSAQNPWQAVRLLASNNWIKLHTRRNCCGHPGQPGC